MISNIKSVTLRLSQKEFNFLMNGINAKFFMDIMSHLRASFSMDEDDTEPQLVYGPTASSISTNSQNVGRLLLRMCSTSCTT